MLDSRLEALDPRPCRDLTLRCGDTCISLNARLAGATWSMTYRGIELIQPQPGNGGSLQSACSFDIPPGASSELENPTEAGNANDSGGATSSVWKICRCNRSMTEAYTETRMAYYWPPGRPMLSGPGVGKPPRNTTVLSNVTLAKSVLFVAPDVLQYRVSFIQGPGEPAHWFGQVEALTGYMHPANLPRRWRLVSDRDRGVVDRVEVAEGADATAPRPGSPSEGVLFASRDGRVAVSVVCVDWPPGGHPYAGIRAAPPWAGMWAGPAKWNFVHHFNAQVSPPTDRIPREPLGYAFQISTGDLDRAADLATRAMLATSAKLTSMS